MQVLNDNLQDIGSLLNSNQITRNILVEIF